MTTNSPLETLLWHYNYSSYLIVCFVCNNTKIPCGGLTWVIKDFNAAVAENRAGFETALGPHGKGERNDSGDWLFSFCCAFDLKVLGSFYQRNNIHRWTWYSRDGIAKKELDHIFVSSRCNATSNCRVKRSAEFGKQITGSNISVYLKNNKEKPPSQRKYNISRLQTPSVKEKFACEIINRFVTLSTLPEDPDSIFEEFPKTVTQTADTHLNKVTRQNNPGIKS